VGVVRVDGVLVLHECALRQRGLGHPGRPQARGGLTC